MAGGAGRTGAGPLVARPTSMRPRLPRPAGRTRQGRERGPRQGGRVPALRHTGAEELFQHEAGLGQEALGGIVSEHDATGVGLARCGCRASQRGTRGLADPQRARPGISWHRRTRETTRKTRQTRPTRQTRARSAADAPERPDQRRAEGARRNPPPTDPGGRTYGAAPRNIRARRCVPRRRAARRAARVAGRACRRTRWAWRPPGRPGRPGRPGARRWAGRHWSPQPHGSLRHAPHHGSATAPAAWARGGPHTPRPGGPRPPTAPA
jgi:hypothetical protein